MTMLDNPFLHAYNGRIREIIQLSKNGVNCNKQSMISKIRFMFIFYGLYISGVLYEATMEKILAMRNFFGLTNKICAIFRYDKI